MKKRFLLVAIFLCICNYAFCVDLQDVELPKDPAYRLGVSSDIEKVFVVVKSKTVETKVAKVENLKNKRKNLSYADMDLKKISREITADIDLDADDIMEDINTLWQGAAMKSETIRFAMYKLSNPEENKPKESVVKKIIQPIASMTTIAGAGIGNPIIAGSALIGGSIFNSLAVDEKELNYKFTKLNDADMIILIRKIDDLQRSLVSLYSDYMTSKRYNEMTINILRKRTEICNSGMLTTKEQILIADTYMKQAQDMQKKARVKFLYDRATLEQLVGHDALIEFETNMERRESKGK